MNNKKLIKFKNIDEKTQKKIFIIALILLIIFSLLLLVSRNFGNYDNIKLKKNKNNIFSITDLTVNNLKFGSNEKEVKESLGKPTKEESKIKKIYNYKIFYYDGLTLKLKENYNDYILVGAKITSNKYETSRKVKVNNGIQSVMNKYKVENSKGTYIYGNYSIDSLNNKEITDNVYFAVRNKNEIVYVNKDAFVDGMNSNIAKLNIAYKYGKVTKITWSYDFE